MNLRFNTEADHDSKDAYTWYERKQEGLGDQFFEELARTIEAVEKRPHLFPLVREAPSGREIRRALLKRFPYLVIYEIHSEEVVILAVAHSSRRPGYWLHRNGGTP